MSMIRGIRTGNSVDFSWDSFVFVYTIDSRGIVDQEQSSELRLQLTTIHTCDRILTCSCSDSLVL